VSSNRLTVVSNRLPFTLEIENGQTVAHPSGGGLVTALLPVLRESGGCWIGWAGSDPEVDVSDALRRRAGPNYSFRNVRLTADEIICFYQGCCNQMIWPLFHGLPSRCDFDPTFWDAYCMANEKFADAVESSWQRDDFVWVHDYHLMMVADCLRARDLRCRLGYFHHIPFPHPEVLEKLPWRAEVLRALLQFNTVGFQTDRDRRNFISCARQFLRDVSLRAVNGKFIVRSGGLCTTVGTYPISIDFNEFDTAAAQRGPVESATEIRQALGEVRIVLGIDRLDYTKGILERLRAFETLLLRDPALRGHVSMLQVVVPSREEVDEYRQLRLAIERRVSEINGRHATPGWVPVHYLYRSLSRSDVVAYYSAADVALVTPLKDGMNLVAKEFCACRTTETGVLILSEFAGAAAELKCGALIVNAYDSEGVAEALQRAFRMSNQEQRSRMRAMRSEIRTHDVFRWAQYFCAQESRSRTVYRPKPAYVFKSPLIATAAAVAD
jgi:alpha,alpha-trehalose-phosphate synthase [UDP-forming]